MRRKRFQKGSIQVRKHGSDKVWVGMWWDDGGRRSKVLGRCSEFSKSHAEALMSQILKEANSQAGHPQAPVYTFALYLQDVFLPVHRRKWKESTRMTTEPRLLHHLIPRFGSQLMTMIKREALQQFLDEKARTLSHSVVDHLRWDLRAIFRLAQSDGVVATNPADGLYTPAAKPGAEKRVMTPDQIIQALSVFAPRERLIFRMAVFAGMRPGEIFAIQLGKIGEASIEIDKRVYKGNLDSPKGRKGKRTVRTVALSPGTTLEIAEWRQQLPNQGPDAWLFPSERQTPLRRDNVWRKYMAPPLSTVGLEWATFQVLRRTNATLSRLAKVDDKVAADQRGHGLGVSLEVYSISGLDQKIEAVCRLESQVIQ